MMKRIIMKLSPIMVVVLLLAGCGGSDNDNTPPRFTSSTSLSVNEDVVDTGYVATAMDDDGDSISFSLIQGADLASFQIDSISGVLSFQSAPSFDNPTDADSNNIYEVEIMASDNKGGTATLGVSIRVNSRMDASVVNGLAAGLEPEFEDGIDDGDPSLCEAPAGSRCWWVDSNAASTQDGSFENPYNSFEVLTGYRDTISSNVAGLVSAGDHIYVKGVFDMNDYEFGIHHPNLYFRNLADYSSTSPIVIKSWKGTPRAIFDGRQLKYSPAGWEYGGMIYINPSQPTNFEIHNIEIRHAHASGIIVVDNVDQLEIANTVIHHTVEDVNLGTAGALSLYARSRQHDYIVRNNVLYSNAINEEDGISKHPRNNNLGAISITAESSALDGSILTVKHNTLSDEGHAIRHKHSGNLVTHIHNNVIKDSHSAAFIRSKETTIHHNILENVESAFIQDRENQKHNMAINIHNNTIVNMSIASELFGTLTAGTSGYDSAIRFDANIYVSPDVSHVFALGAYSSSVFDWAWWDSSGNILDIDSEEDVLLHGGNIYKFLDAMSVMSDSTSAIQSVSLDENYALSPDSMLCDAATALGYVGAIACE